jgi:valyl-tRNA synthetase
MPFLTEEIWQHLRVTGSAAARRLSGWTRPLPESVMIARWPEPGNRDEKAERSMGLVMELIHKVRAVRSEFRVDPAKYVAATLVTGSDSAVLRGQADIIARLARLQPFAITDALPEKPADAVSVFADGVMVYLPLHELTDVAAERARLEKELQEARMQAAGVRTKLANDSFLTRAPGAVVDRERARARGLSERIRRLEDRVEMLGGG